MSGSVAAVDLGATSGRVILGHVGPNELRLQHVARFANRPVTVPEQGGAAALHWDILGLWSALGDGLAAAARLDHAISSIGVDSWAVDYGLLRDGRLVGLPYHYRDSRSTAGLDAVHAALPADELYRLSGLAHLPFNTLFQLAADRAAGTLDFADRALLVPDLIGRWLTGVDVTERTNASTTGMLSPVTGGWEPSILTAVGASADLFAPLVEPGTALGGLLPSLASSLGGGRGIPVTAVGSHDTASAVVGVPIADEHAAYISSGTWSLVGLEVERPIITDAGRAANFTNEGGVDGRVRFLKNISGLWLLSESMRVWDAEATSSRASTDSTRASDLASLLAAAADVTGPVAVFDASDERFTPPGDMPGRITAWCDEHGVPAPQTRPDFVRSILESLAAAYARTLDEAETLSGRTITTVHVVGGGSQNELLCRLTADRTGRIVLAGPVEATAIGNVLVQARAAGLVPTSSSLESLRALVRQAYPPVRYEPAAASV
ncbi:carbohydrate kinase [Frondihabitans sp. PAMC 28766]|uniref:rhamnulokinase n=1 Tax=Frondihabitans sp. PAMC 28766 TaxID=1795630 RepID=UPI00078B65CC|nr:rhamnulokinase family protein [Frondihabitans sp. PAMC 28766]AMM18822.1 carbohydrate kinase [Frondihabitans sp. PAMC 28766]